MRARKKLCCTNKNATKTQNAKTQRVSNKCSVNATKNHQRRERDGERELYKL